MAERGCMWLAAGFAAGLSLVGIPYWRLPYNADYFADIPVLLGFAGLGVVTAMLAASGAARLRRIFWTMLAAFPVAVAIRVVIDIMKDPTDHNLWPFEILFAAIVSLVAVIPGLLVGALVRKAGGKN